jgi:hypothetical protein
MLNRILCSFEAKNNYYEEVIIRFDDGSEVTTLLDRPTMEKINAGGLSLM